MRTDIDELGLCESTDADLALAIISGGWIESWVRCLLEGCRERFPHRHYICGTCGAVDFAGIRSCQECWNMEQTHRAGRGISRFREKYGMALARLGLCVLALVLIGVSTWRIA